MDSNKRFFLDKNKGEFHYTNFTYEDIKINQTIERNGVINGFKQQIFEKIQMFMGYPLNKDDESSDED